MNEVFLGGSRRVTRLGPAVRSRLAEWIEDGATFLIGDANGADKAMQRFLAEQSYDQVTVYCMSGSCRNNLAQWKTEAVTPTTKRITYEFFAAKDRQMALRAGAGLMLWDKKSFGTAMNVYRLLIESRPVFLSIPGESELVWLKDEAGWDQLFSLCDEELRERLRDQISAEASRRDQESQQSLF